MLGTPGTAETSVLFIQYYIDSISDITISNNLGGEDMFSEVEESETLPAGVVTVS